MFMKRLQRYLSFSYLTGALFLVFVLLFLWIGFGQLVADYETKSLEQRSASVERQCNVLANRVVEGGFASYTMGSKEETEESRIEETTQLANDLGGRVLIIDSHFKILTDTYNRNCGKYLVTSETVNALKGDPVPYRKIGENYIQVITRINDEKSGEPIGLILAAASLYDRNSLLGHLRVQRATLTGIFFLITAVISLLIIVIMLRNFQRMQIQLNSIAAGHQERGLSRGGFREFYRMSGAINRILNRYSELENSRQEFVSNVSHELKTPLTSMKILADSLIGQQGVPEELYQEFIVDISNETVRANQIIQDLLYLVKMDGTNQAAMNVKPTNINELLEVLLKRISPIAAKRDITIHLETIREVVAEVDEVKLALACNNLIENAVKYNKDGGRVDVSLNADHKFFYIRIKDTGCGIPEDSQQQIFERFYRVDKARSRETGGTGLGLAITRKVLLMHKGSIKVHSQEGTGSTFIVRVPLNYIE